MEGVTTGALDRTYRNNRRALSGRFPPAFKTVEVADGTVTIDTVPLNDIRPTRLFSLPMSGKQRFQRVKGRRPFRLATYEVVFCWITCGN